MALAWGALSACGTGDKPADRVRAHPLTISVTEPAPGRFRYLAPKSIPAGLVGIRFTNVGKVPHKAQLWRVGGGHTVRQALRHARRPLPRWLETAGGVGLTQPDRTGTSLQRLSPGRYYVAGSGDERGTVASIRVTAARGSDPLPKPSARIIARDYGYRASGLKAGRTEVDFRNAGKEPHHAFFAPMREGATLADVRAFLDRKFAGPPPIGSERASETVVIEGGDRQVTELRFESGRRYAVLCFVSDRNGGPPHTEKGMIAEVRVP